MEEIKFNSWHYQRHGESVYDTVLTCNSIQQLYYSMVHSTLNLVVNVDKLLLQRITSVLQSSTKYSLSTGRVRISSRGTNTHSVGTARDSHTGDCLVQAEMSHLLLMRLQSHYIVRPINFNKNDFRIYTFSMLRDP